MRNRLIGFIGALAAATCLVAQTGPAQRTRTPPTPEEIAAARVQRLTRLLDLTTAQQESAKKIFTDEAVALQNARPAMKAAHEAMQNAVKNTGLAADVDRAAAQLGAAHTTIAAAHGKAQVQFRALLTADQKAKLDEFGGARRGPGPRRGRGPGGGPMRGGFGGFGAQ
jgi:Spy/CpxP family protein refolding chaperone